MIRDIQPAPNLYLRMGATFFGLLFLVSAAAKVARPSTTERMVYSLHRLFHKRFRLWTKIVIVAEGLTGVCLLAEVAAKAVLILTTALLLLFDVVLVRVRQRGFYESCGCFGSADSTKIGTLHYVRNAVLTALSAYLLYCQELVPERARGSNWPAELIGAVGFVLAVAAYVGIMKRSGGVTSSPSIQDAPLRRVPPSSNHR